MITFTVHESFLNIIVVWCQWLKWTALKFQELKTLHWRADLLELTHQEGIIHIIFVFMKPWKCLSNSTLRQWPKKYWISNLLIRIAENYASKHALNIRTPSFSLASSFSKYSTTFFRVYGHFEGLNSTRVWIRYKNCNFIVL